MQSELVEEIAAQVVREEILSNWLYWAILLGTLLLGSFFGNLLAGFGRKRGELAATSAKYTEILEQVRKSTQATEEIRSAISMGEWSKKEHAVLRRIKLEEVMLAALQVHEWILAENKRIMFTDHDSATPSPMPKAQALGRLYLPELEQALREFDAAYDKVHIWLLELAGKLVEAKRAALQNGDTAVVQAQNAVRRQAQQDMLEHYEVFLRALRPFERDAASLMRHIVTAEESSGKAGVKVDVEATATPIDK